MPNGVICGGAVDGSNPLGEIVTCQAMTTRPDGAGAPAIDGLAPNSTMATRREPIARRKRRYSNEIIRPSSQLSRILHAWASIESIRGQGFAQGAARSENRRTRNSISAVTFDGLGPPGGITMLSAIGGADHSLMTASRRPARRSRQ